MWKIRYILIMLTHIRFKFIWLSALKLKVIEPMFCLTLYPQVMSGSNIKCLVYSTVSQKKIMWNIQYAYHSVVSVWPSDLIFSHVKRKVQFIHSLCFILHIQACKCIGIIKSWPFSKSGYYCRTPPSEKS